MHSLTQQEQDIMGTIMKNRHYTQHHITLSLARSGALLMLLLLFSICCLLPGEVNAAAITCSAGVSGCHFAPTTTPMIKDGTGRNTPSGRFTGSHARHSGYSTSSAKGQYNYACTVCHGLAGGYNNAHQTGFKNLSSSSLPGNRYSAGKKIANTNSPAFGNCNNIYCHSSGRAAGMGQIQYSSVRWGGTKTCLGCHGGRASATGAPAKSVGGFTLSTSHSQHLKYPAANINCQICHSKSTQTDAWTLKTYTAATHHVNGVREVEFTNLAYASYTSYKKAGVNLYKCSNTSCHGGLSRSAWSASTQNSNHTCTHCHGVDTGVAAGMSVTGANRYNLRFFAPGWAKTGTSTDQTNSSNNIRVGSHFKHLSSVYMKNIKCNECHLVPYTPFQAGTNHTLNTTRFNSGTLDFSQSSSARILIGVASGSTPAQLSAFAGYTNGLSNKASTCSSVYCHGYRQKGADTTGSYRKPYWNYSAMINYGDKTNACGRCHGNPPRHGSYSTTHKDVARNSYTTCNPCHNNVTTSGNFVNKALHIDGRVQASGGHEWSFGGLRHKNGGTGSITANPNSYSNCTGCHSLTGGGTYPVARGDKALINCALCHINQTNFTNTPGCGDCHGTNATGQPNGAANAFPNWSGSHTNHTAQGFACADCHQNAGSGTAIHGNYSGKAAKTRLTVNMKFNTAKSGTAATYTAATMTCTTSTCHGQKSPAWGSATPSPSCVRCHGYQSLATLNNYTQNSIAPGTGNIDTNRVTGITARGGLHQEHLKGSSNLSRKVRCIECHISTTVVNHGSLDNMTTAAMTFSGVATALSHTPTVSRVSGIINCSTNECHHGGARADGTAAGQSGIATRTLPKWNDSALLGNTTIADTCTGKCHNMPPGGAVSGDTHSGLTASGTYTTPTQVATACSSCHAPLSASGTTLANLWADMKLHINGTVDAASKCVDCHAVAKGTRSIITGASGEFGLAWGHKKSGRGAVTDDDCIVCHLEGDSTTKKINPTYHLGLPNGNIDLRDPDGTGEAAIAGLTFTKFATSYAAGSRTSSIGTTVDFKITQLFCLKCHDAGGATNTTARAGSSPSATAPFGGGFTATNSYAQFATTNSSKHPILGPLTKDYPTAARMADPYKPTGTRGTSGTTSAGVVMNCFDCHNTPTTPLTARTVAAHGNANTIRGTIQVASPTFCNVCHLNYAVVSQHGTGSAFAVGDSQMKGTVIPNCDNCHAASSTGDSDLVRAENVHGTSTLPASGTTAKTGRWVSSPLPISFIRNTASLTNHQPRVAGGTTYAPQCSMNGDNAACAARPNSPYSLGGTY